MDYLMLPVRDPDQQRRHALGELYELPRRTGPLRGRPGSRSVRRDPEHAWPGVCKPPSSWRPASPRMRWSSNRGGDDERGDQAVPGGGVGAGVAGRAHAVPLASFWSSSGEGLVNVSKPIEVDASPAKLT